MDITDIPVIVPIRGYETSMTRLRKHISDEIVDLLVRESFQKVIEVLKSFNMNIIVVTSDPKLVEGTGGEYKIIRDQGTSINMAINLAIDKVESQKTMLVMPDLPGISTTEFERYLAVIKLHGFCISPNRDGGTSMLFGPVEVFREHFLGNNSSEKIQNYFERKEIPLARYISRNIEHDLDDIDDLAFWQEKSQKIRQISLSS